MDSDNQREYKAIIASKSRKFIVLRACRESAGYVWKIISLVFAGLFVFLALEFVLPHNTHLYDTTTRIKAIKKLNHRRPSTRDLDERFQRVGKVTLDTAFSFYNTALFLLDKANFSVGVEIYLLRALKLPGGREASTNSGRTHFISVVVEPRMLNGLRFYARSTREVAIGLDVSGVIFKELTKKIISPDKLGAGNFIDPKVAEHNYVNLKKATEGINTNLNSMHLSLVELSTEIKNNHLRGQKPSQGVRLSP